MTTALAVSAPTVKAEYNRLCDVKGVILENIEDADCGIFFCRNCAGDSMENIYSHDGVEVDICYYYSYFEVFGLTKDEEKELERFYEHARGRR